MRPTEKIQNLIQNLNDTTRPELDEKILDNCFRELNTQKASTPAKGPNIWSVIIHNSITKYAAMVVFLLILAGAVAVKIMTPTERIEVMDELEKSHGQPAYDPDSNGKVAEEDKVTVAGTIRTWDGGMINRRTPMLLYVTCPGK